MTKTTKSLVGVASSILLAGCSVFGYRGGTETPDHHVVDHAGDVEIRAYGPRLTADTVVDAPSVEKAREQGFKRLAGYIFGDNTQDQKIAMTAPVAQSADMPRSGALVAEQAEAPGWRIRFFLPSDMTLATAPAPHDARIKLHAVPGDTYAVKRFSGSRSNNAVAKQFAELNQTLAQSPWHAVGEPVAWFYDPPWTLPFLRRNEVAVPVARDDAS